MNAEETARGEVTYGAENTALSYESGVPTVIAIHTVMNTICVRQPSGDMAFYEGRTPNMILRVTEFDGSGVYIFQAQDYPGIYEVEQIGSPEVETFPEHWDAADHTLVSRVRSIALWLPEGSTVDFIENVYDETTHELKVASA